MRKYNLFIPVWSNFDKKIYFETFSLPFKTKYNNGRELWMKTFVYITCYKTIPIYEWWDLNQTTFLRHNLLLFTKRFSFFSIVKYFVLWSPIYLLIYTRFWTFYLIYQISLLIGELMNNLLWVVLYVKITEPPTRKYRFYY